MEILLRVLRDSVGVAEIGWLDTAAVKEYFMETMENSKETTSGVASERYM
jgi:hypothetical protein